jgi:hypothetical protein
MAFALSFSRTVFAVKSLNESGDMGAMHGRITIGMLIMQDILAVLFLTFSAGKIPTLWALPMLAALLLGRKWIPGLINRSGHGEMIALCGLFLALVLGAEGFTAVGLKGRSGGTFHRHSRGLPCQSKRTQQIPGRTHGSTTGGLLLTDWFTGLDILGGVALGDFSPLLASAQESGVFHPIDAPSTSERAPPGCPV